MGNIPENITREDIIKAIKLIDHNGVPPKNKSTKYDIKYNNKYYPPKYTICLANQFRNKRILRSDEIFGGEESNSFLRRRGFEIVEKGKNIPSCSENVNSKNEMQEIISELDDILKGVENSLNKYYDIFSTFRQMAGELAEHHKRIKRRIELLQNLID